MLFHSKRIQEKNNLYTHLNIVNEDRREITLKILNPL